MRRLLRISLPGPLLAVALSAPPSWASSTENCAVLEKQDAPQSPLKWFERSLLAGHCYRFDALAVRFGAGGFRSLAIHHDVDAEGEKETVHFLDGPAQQFERKGHFLRNGWFEQPTDNVADVEKQAVSQLDSYYRFTIEGTGRIADREVVVLSIVPRDGMRYAHQLWLDKTTALPLKQLLVNESGNILEAFQISQISTPELFKGVLRVDPNKTGSPATSNWQAQWLPPGYEQKPVEATVDIDGASMARQLYSDGLSTLSVFVGPLTDATALREGVHRLGVLQAAVRHIQHQGEPYQIVVVGEVPTEVLTRIVTSVQWQASPSS